MIKIINFSSKVGITTFDTAQAYGVSEARLGNLLKPKSQIVTKIGVFDEKKFQKNMVKSAALKSLELLNVKSLEGILLHRPELLTGNYGPQILNDLVNLKEQGYVKKIGFSIYTPEILEDIVKIFTPDIVQAPFNIFDQRFFKSGWAQRLKSIGTEIHVRSVFLQGLLLMKAGELPLKFKSTWPELFERWFAYQSLVGENADTISLGYCLQQPWIDKIIVGVDNIEQIERLSDIERRNFQSPFSGFNVKDEKLINPSNWDSL